MPCVYDPGDDLSEDKGDGISEMHPDAKSVAKAGEGISFFGISMVVFHLSSVLQSWLDPCGNLLRHMAWQLVDSMWRATEWSSVLLDSIGPTVIQSPVKGAMFGTDGSFGFPD